MKKTALLLIISALFVAFTCIPASAKGASDWVAGNGFLIDGKNSPVTVTETADGVQVSHGGYYVNGVDWGGIASANKYKIDGLSVDVRFDTVPTPNDDNWIYIGFLSKPQLFQVGDIPGNPGYVCLIRFNSSTWEHYECVDSFAQSYAQTDNSFAVKSGDTLKFAVKVVNGEYVITLNGVECDTNFSNLPAVFPDGEAYIVISASQKDSAADAFKYTILSVNGEKTVGAAETTAAPADTAAADTSAPATTDTTAAQTSDIISGAVVLAIAAAGIAIFAIKKSREQ